jgi:7-carboxy-7-deazaguanine synthase
MSAALPISETFYSIQGEGKLTGVPSFFIRVSGCNLRCGWCDTPYASWNPEGQRRSVADLIAEARATGARHAVLTGGEPMMFDELVPLAAGLRDAGLHITIETAGTIARPVACDLMSLSPKLSNSAPLPGDPRDPAGTWRERHEQRRTNLPALQALLDAHPTPGHQLKFVVSSPADLVEIDALLAQLRGWQDNDVLLMPEGVTTPAPEQLLWLVDACRARRWRLSPRVHLVLFGNRRGT